MKTEITVNTPDHFQIEATGYGTTTRWMQWLRGRGRVTSFHGERPLTMSPDDAIALSKWLNDAGVSEMSSPERLY